jgi:protein-S-isoprenylcysteine O-methyltransferase Ste14
MNHEIAFRLTALVLHLLVKGVRWLCHRTAAPVPAQEGFAPDTRDAAAAFFFTLASEASLWCFVLAPGWISGLAFPCAVPVRWAGAAVGVLALGLFLWSHSALADEFSVFLQLRQEHRLVEHGPYRYIRHPIYTVSFLLGIAYTLLSANGLVALCWLGGGALFFRARIRREEAMLSAGLGDRYRAYMQRTGSLLPRLTRRAA